MTFRLFNSNLPKLSLNSTYKSNQPKSTQNHDGRGYTAGKELVKEIKSDNQSFDCSIQLSKIFQDSFQLTNSQDHSLDEEIEQQTVKKQYKCPRKQHQYQQEQTVKQAVKKESWKVNLTKPARIKININTSKTLNHQTNQLRQAMRQQVKRQFESLTSKQTIKKSTKIKKIFQTIDLISSQSSFQIVEDLEKINRQLQEVQQEPLRDRYSHLLEQDERYIIGRQHKRLIEIMKSIDSTIQFANNIRNKKGYFLIDLIQSLQENNRIELTKQHVQQLLFLDPALYSFQWAYNQNRRYYDLLIGMPTVQCFQERVENFRKCVVLYLLQKEKEFLDENKLKKTNFIAWHEKFDPNTVQIPKKQLPIHPLSQEKPKSQMTKQKEKYFKKVMEKQQAKKDTKCSEDIKAMTFTKKTHKEIRDRLCESIRKKEARLPKPTNKTIIDHEMLLNICDEAMIIMMSRSNICHIFKVCFIEKVQKKYGYKKQSIVKCLSIIVTAPSEFIRQKVIPSRQMITYKIDKKQYKAARQYLQNFQIN